ncbi:MAG: mycothiol synthase [Actinomycetota bacterium]|nr:mycothiol synthase [Actinomycetota bacterium]
MSTFLSQVADLASRVAAFDHVEPLNEASLLALRDGIEPRVDIRFETPDGQLMALAFTVGDAPVEVMVDPRFRRGGFGTRMVEAALSEGETAFWAHGDLPGTAQIARKTGLVAERTLLILRKEFDGPGESENVPDGVTLRSFAAGDEDAIVAVNGRAFANHPEQGAMDRADFDRRMSSDWFDPGGLFVAERAGRIIGFHWTKIESDVGEVYVVGIDPEAQGGGLGKALTARGLRHLHELGVPAVILYVEGDNEPALAVYRRLGFHEFKKDVLYSKP